MRFAIEVLERERLNIRAYLREISRLANQSGAGFDIRDEEKRLADIDDAIEVLQRAMVEAERKAAGVANQEERIF